MRVVYSSRRQAEKLVKRIKQGGIGSSFTFGQRRDPCVGLFGKVMGLFQRTDPFNNICVVVNTNVPGLPSAAAGEKQPSTTGHRNKVRSVWTSTDSVPMMEMDPETLEPIGFANQASLHPSLTGPTSCAHAQRDPETGDMFNFNLAFGRTATYRIFRVNAATGTTDILATICDPGISGAYIHSFFLTTNYVVLCVPVSHFRLGGLSVPLERNILDAIAEFDESKVCKWLVVDRWGSQGLIASFDSPAAFFFHTANSFDEPSADGSGTDLFCDVVEYPNQDVMRSFYYDVLLNRNDAATTWWNEKDRIHTVHPRLVRHKLHIPHRAPDGGRALSCKRPFTGNTEVVSTVDAPHAGELPTYNPAFQCKRYRYVYSLSNHGRSTLLDSIVKSDMDTREALLYGCPHGHTPGEPIFVPRPAAEGEVLAEDDGVLLSVVLDGSARRSYLLCLDAKTLQEVGRADCPFAVGLGFHGTHAPTGNI